MKPVNVLICLSSLLALAGGIAAAAPAYAADDGASPAKAVFKPIKGHKQLSHRDQLIAEAEKNLSSEDFDRFMTDVGTLEEKVKQGRPRSAIQGPAGRETAEDTLSGEGVPPQVEFGGAEAPIQKSDDFFHRPVSE